MTLAGQRTDAPADGSLIRLRKGGGPFRVGWLRDVCMLAGTRRRVAFVPADDPFPVHEPLAELDEAVTSCRDFRDGHFLPDAGQERARDLFRVILQREFHQDPAFARRFLFRYGYQGAGGPRLCTRPSFRYEGPWIVASIELLPARHFARLIPAERASQLRALAQWVREWSSSAVDAAVLDEYLSVCAAAWLLEQGAPWLRVPARWAAALSERERLGELAQRKARLRGLLPESVFETPAPPFSFEDEVQRYCFESSDGGSLANALDRLDRPDAPADLLRDAAFHHPFLASRALAHPAFPRESVAEAALRGRLAAWNHWCAGDAEREALLDSLVLDDPLPGLKRNFLLNAELKPEWRLKLALNGNAEIARALLDRSDLPAEGYRALLARFPADMDILEEIAGHCPYPDVLSELATLDGAYECAAPCLRLAANPRTQKRALLMIIERFPDGQFRDEVLRAVAQHPAADYDVLASAGLLAEQ